MCMEARIFAGAADSFTAPGRLPREVALTSPKAWSESWRACTEEARLFAALEVKMETTAPAAAAKEVVTDRIAFLIVPPTELWRSRMTDEALVPKSCTSFPSPPWL